MQIPCLVAAVVFALAALVPPISDLARRAAYASALQFSFLAIVVPALVALGAPWRLVGLAARPGGSPRTLDRVADRRRRHRGLSRAVGFVVLQLAVVVAWRTPAAVNSLTRHGWLAPFEALSLLAVGLCLWLELVPSPPLLPRSGPLRRAALAALVMWAFWVDAYVVGLSNSNWYPNFHHSAGQGLSAAADQQIASVVLWFVAAAAFVPVVFWNAFAWLRSEEDPDAELSRLTADRYPAQRAPRAPGDSSPAPGA